MLTLLLLLAFQQKQPIDPPSVVLVVWDDVAAADCSTYGGPVPTPNLSSLASLGVRFDRCYSNPTCAPTRRSIHFGHWWLTGNGEGCDMEPVGPNTPSPVLDSSLPRLSPRYSHNFFGKWHLGTSVTGVACAPAQHGWENFIQGMAGNVQGCGGSAYFAWNVAVACGWVPSSEYEPRAVQDEFLSLWPMLRKPALVCVNSNLAHTPFHIPPPDFLPSGYSPANSARGRFEAMVVASDVMLGRFLASINLSKTVVIVVGDNGTPPTVAPDRDKAKGTTFERGVRVPLVIAGGPSLAGLVNSSLVHVVDLHETMRALFRSKPGPSRYPLVGESLVPILEGKATSLARDKVLVGQGWGTDEGDVAAVSAVGLKLRRLDRDGDMLFDSEELYDLVSDPNETVNRISDPTLQADIQALRAWIDASVTP